MCARDVLTRSGAAVTYQRATTATTCHIEAGSGRVGGDVQIAAQQVTVSAERDPRQRSPGYNLGQTCASLASAHGVGKPELLWHRHMQKQLKPSCTVMATHCTLRSLSSQPGTVPPAIPTLKTHHLTMCVRMHGYIATPCATTPTHHSSAWPSGLIRCRMLTATGGSLKCVPVAGAVRL